jgi:hypothetical protein
MPTGDLVKAQGGANCACSERKPGDKREVVAFANPKYVFPAASEDAVAILDGDDGRDRTSTSELIDINIGNAHVINLAFALKLGQRTHRLLDRNIRIDGV